MPWKKSGGLQSVAWADLTDPGEFEGQRRPAIGPEGKLIIVEYSASTGWLPVRPTAADYTGVALTPRPAGSYVPMGTRSYLLPSGLTAMGSRNTTTTYTYRYRPAGPANQQYQRVRIGWRVQSNQTCTLDRMYLSSAGSAVNAVTENTATGWLTAVAAPVVIGPGSNLMFGSVQWLGEWEVTPNTAGDIYITAQASGASIPTVNHGNATGGKDTIGWVRTGKEFVTNQLTSGTFAPMTGGEGFGTGFPLVIEFIGLQTPVCPLGFFGDSHTWGYGDDAQPSRPSGISQRLDDAWRASGARIAAINIARVGATTTQINEALGLFLANFPAMKIVAVQQGSVNNYSNALPNSQLQADWLAAEAAVFGAGRRLIGFSAFFTSTPTNWATHKAHWDWCHARLGVRSVQSTRVNVVNESDGNYVAGMAYSDNGHGNTLAYDTWGTTSLVPFQNALINAGVVL